MTIIMGVVAKLGAMGERYLRINKNVMNYFS
jgi:hypothetical protein